MLHQPFTRIRLMDIRKEPLQPRDCILTQRDCARFFGFRDRSWDHHVFVRIGEIDITPLQSPLSLT
jgi:hypothetical protein